MRRVAITSMGAVSAPGVGVPALWRGLLAARSGIRRMYSAAASRLSIMLGLRGPTLCFATACAAAAHAIGEAAEAIRAGRADVMLAGGADAPITYTPLSRLGRQRGAAVNCGDQAA